MAFIFELSDEIRTLASNAQYDMLSALGKPIKLVYMGEKVPCDACSIDTVSNQNLGTYPPGRGPGYGDNCRVCNNSGYRQEEVVETISAIINWEISSFIKIPGLENLNVRGPGSVAQIKTTIDIFPKIMKCKYAIFQVPMTNYFEFKFTLNGVPLDISNIVPGKFCVSFWESMV